MKTEALLTTNSMNRSSLRSGFLLIAVAFAWFAPAPVARAACQQGCLTNNNTVLGDDALLSNTAGNSDTAIGFQALFSNISGWENTATGDTALFSNTTGWRNTATGVRSLYSNANGFGNTATGVDALYFNTSGVGNTATGDHALHDNTIGANNTATGSSALYDNTTGVRNTATGSDALADNTTGNYNTATGFYALLRNTTGNKNIALGFKAGMNLTAGDNNIEIGNLGVAGDNNTIRIGTQGTQSATFIAGISGATVANGVGVIIDTNGHLGTLVSSERFKDAIKPMDKASEVIHALKPVTFHYKHELDPDGIPQFGLVAEDVEKVNPDLVARDDQGKPYTVRYEAVNAMLLNEFLNEHKKGREQDRKIDEQGVRLAEQEKQIQALMAMVKEQAAQIEKVNAQLEVSSPGLQLVENNQ
jgi:uncharacterized coiled-coil protein SlyX